MKYTSTHTNVTVKTCAVLLGLVLLSTHHMAFSEVYKWVDENGKTHFGDKAPAKETAEDIAASLEKTNVDSSSKTVTSSVTNTTKTQDEIDQENKKEEEKKAATAGECKYLKDGIEGIEAGKRVIFLDKNDKEIFFPEKEMGNKLAEWKARYKKLGCS